MARPTKFTKPTVDALLAGILAGLPYHLAASAAGISETTFHDWQRGKLPRNADKQLKAEFLEASTRARGESARRFAALISTAAKDDWRAAAWMLERRFPRDFGRDGELMERIERLEELAQDQRPHHPGLRRLS